MLTDDNTLQALKPYSGSLIWAYRAGEPLTATLVVGEDFTVYLFTKSHKLIAVTPGGTVRWKREFNSSLSGPPAASPEGALVLPMEDGRLIKINGRGRVLWEKSTAFSYTAPVIDQDGSIYISGKENTIICYTPTGNEDWRLPLDGRAVNTAFKGDVFLAATAEGELYGLSVKGELLWGNTSLPAGDPVSLLATESKITLVYSSGMIVFLSPDGRETGRFQGPETPGYASCDSKGALYLYGTDKKLYRLYDGDLSEIDSDTAMTAPLLGAAANLFSGGENWIVYSYKTPPSATGWSGYRGGPLRNGAVDSGASLKRLRDYYENYRGYLYFQMMSESPELDKRLEMIDSFEKMYKENKLIEEYPFAPLILISMAEEGISYSSFDGSLVSNSSALVRIKALNLLGEIGDIRTRKFIINLLYHEDNASAAVSAIWALGQIGYDYDGDATRAIAAMKDRFFNDDSVLMSICDTLEEIVYYNGIVPDQSGLHVLSSIYTSNAPYRIRKRAGAVFDKFTGE